MSFEILLGIRFFGDSGIFLAIFIMKLVIYKIQHILKEKWNKSAQDSLAMQSSIFQLIIYFSWNFKKNYFHLLVIYKNLEIFPFKIDSRLHKSIVSIERLLCMWKWKNDFFFRCTKVDCAKFEPFFRLPAKSMQFAAETIMHSYLK